MRARSLTGLLSRMKKTLCSSNVMILLMVLVIMSISTIYIYVTVYSNERNREVFNMIRAEERGRKWEIIEQIIVQSDALARTSTRISALELEQSLRQAYPEFEMLQDEFDNDKLSDKFHNILSEQFDISTNQLHPYLTFVGTKEHMIGSFGSTSDSIVGKLDTDTKFVPWSEVYKHAISPDVASEAFSQVVKQSKNISFMQTRDLKGDEIKNVSLSEIRRIYEKHGIDGLKSISLLSPAYITETGDMFGERDLYYMQKNDNHKIILIQFINLGKMLESKRDVIEASGERYEFMEKFMISNNSNQVLLAIIWTFIMFIISVGLIMIYNMESRKNRSLRDHVNSNKI